MAQVIWSPSALKRVEEIGDYIALDAPERAVAFVRRLLDSTRHLEQFPLSGPICPEDPTCRQVIVESYRVIYEIKTESIDILAVIAPGQDALLAIEKK